MSRVWCSWAACRNPASAFIDGHPMCSPHIREHRLFQAEEQRRADALTGLRTVPGRQKQPCGTHAAYERHRAQGEYPCPECRDAERRFQAERYRKRRKAS